MQKRNDERLKEFTAEIFQLDLFKRCMSLQTECNIPSSQQAEYLISDIVIMNTGERLGECLHIGCTKNLLTK